MALGEGFPLAKHIAILLLLGFVAYGLSIYCYTYAQRTIGAARTSTYYALAPFIGAALSFLLLVEPLTPLFLVAALQRHTFPLSKKHLSILRGIAAT